MGTLVVWMAVDVAFACKLLRLWSKIYQHHTNMASCIDSMVTLFPETNFVDILILRMYFLTIKMNNFRGDISHVSAKRQHWYWAQCFFCVGRYIGILTQNIIYMYYKLFIGRIEVSKQHLIYFWKRNHALSLLEDWWWADDCWGHHRSQKSVVWCR